MITEWRFVKLDKYPRRIICDNGEVYSGKGKPLSLKLGKGGYLRVRMYHLNRESYSWVHRMICYAFVGNAFGKDCHHKDRNRRNNHWTNFEILTEQDHINKHRK